jgi:outer membrane murein-binding lipoprotein Lpp
VSEKLVLFAVIVAALAAAGSVFACWWTLRAVAKISSTSSMLGELHEIRDYLSKIDAWSKRINARLVMEERRDTGTAPADIQRARSAALPLEPAALKAELRRRAGIVAGQPAAHRE